LINTDGVCITLKHFDDVALTKNNDGRYLATVGGGCTIRRLLKLLNKHSLTTPSVGLITSQTIAGAISTGTHGSGRQSLSHYIKSVRLAVIDSETGQAVVKTYDRGPELAAARCGLGCLGVLISVQFYCIPQFAAAECTQVVDTVEDVLRLEDKYPIQQFYLIPHVDEIYVSTRREAQAWDGTTGLKSILYRIYCLLGIDFGYHLFVLLMGRFSRSGWFIRWFYRKVFPRVILRDTVVVDRSDRILTMAHELFRHFETELFVKESHLKDAVVFVNATVDAFADRNSLVSESFATSVKEMGMSERLHQLRGSWVHHYPICVRKVLPDDTLISMSAGTEAVYAISFITYDRDRRDFRNFSSFLTKTMATRFGARPHWGKHFDLSPEMLRSLYPKFDRFNRIRQKLDPDGRFGNAFLDDIMEPTTET
jgi:FAD/FMN-containing dehydrogenase